MADKAPLEIEITTTPATEIAVDPATDPTNKGGGEGSENQQQPSKTISDDDILQLQKDLAEAKAEAKRERETATTAHSQRIASEQRANETASQVASEVEQRIKAQEDLIKAGQSSVESEIAALRSVITQAQSEGKWAEASEAIENMADAKARLREYAREKSNLDAYKEQLKAQPKPSAQPQVGTRTQAWIAAHPRFGTDRVYYATAMLAHEQAIASNLAPESDAYFEHIEKALGERPTVKTETQTPEPKTETKAAPTNGSAPVAGVQRRAQGSSTNTPNKITLTGEEVEQADSLFGEPGTPMYIKDPKERYTYWHNSKKRLQSEGRLP